MSRRIEGTGTGAECIGITAAVGYVFGQCPIGVDAAHVERAIRQRAECAAAADVGDLEPDALLGADTHHGEVAIQRDAGVLQSGDGDEPRHHAGGAVEVAAVRDRIEMRADDDSLRLRIATGKGHVEVGCGIMLDAQAEPLRDSGHRRMRSLLARTVRIARYARFVEPVTSELVEQRCREFALSRHRRGEIHLRRPLYLRSGDHSYDRTSTTS